MAEVTFRPWTPDDLNALVEVLNSSYRADGVEQVFTVDRLRSTYANIDPVHSDLSTDMFMVETDDDLVGYGRVEWRDEPGGPRVYQCVGEVDGEHRNRGIGTQLLQRLVSRVDEIRATHPPGPKVLEGWGWDSATSRIELLKDFGFKRASMDVEMIRPHLRDIPLAPMPEGLIVRTPSDSELRKVWESDIEAFRDHWGFVEQSETDFQKFHDFPYNDPTLWRVAWDGDKVVGQVRSFIDPEENEAFGRKRGYTEDISVLRPYRGRGLARSLLVQSLHALAERGMQEAGLGVHVDNPNGAFRLYESVGFVQTASFGTWRKTLE